MKLFSKCLISAVFAGSAAVPVLAQSVPVPPLKFSCQNEGGAKLEILNQANPRNGMDAFASVTSTNVRFGGWAKLKAEGSFTVTKFTYTGLEGNFPAGTVLTVVKTKTPGHGCGRGACFDPPSGQGQYQAMVTIDGQGVLFSCQ